MEGIATNYRWNAAQVRDALCDLEFSLKQMRVVDGIVRKSLALGRGRAWFASHQMLGDFVRMQRPHVSATLDELSKLKVVECRRCVYMVLLPISRWHVKPRGLGPVEETLGEEWRLLSEWLDTRDPEAAYDGSMPVAVRDFFGYKEDELNESLRSLQTVTWPTSAGGESDVPGNGSRTAGSGDGIAARVNDEGTESVRGSAQVFAKSCETGVTELVSASVSGAGGTESVPSSPFSRTDSVPHGKGRDGRLSVSVSRESFKRSTLNAAAAAGPESVRTPIAVARSRGMGLPEEELLEELGALFGSLRIYAPIPPGEKCTIMGPHLHGPEMAISGGMWRKCARLMAEELTELLSTIKDRLRTGRDVKHPPAWMVSWMHRHHRRKWDQLIRA
jgi:hypothetical protein